jgi:hypothetical protein
MTGMIESFAKGWVNARQQAGTYSDGPIRSESAAGLAAELEETKAALAALVEAHESLEVRAARFADVLQHPGVRLALLGAIHPDRHAKASAEDRRELDELAAKINTAYDTLKEDEA